MTQAGQRLARLTRSADFDRVYRHGRSVQRRQLVLYLFERPDHDADSPPRLGLTISRKVGGATERNRLKRQVKEALAQLDASIPGHDLVVIARPGLVEAVDANGFEWLTAELGDLLTEAQERLQRRTPRGA